MIFFQEIEKVTLEFKCGSLGVTCKDWASGVITEIKNGSQSEALGVEIGWKMIAIGIEKYSKEVLIRTSRAQKTFDITFEFPAVRSSFSLFLF